jgi:hypothetical protein
MPRFSGNKMNSSHDSNRHFTLVNGNKEYGLFHGSTPSAAALMVATKLCSLNKGKKVEFYIRENTQGSKKKTYGPYVGEVKKLKNSEFNGNGKSYKIVAKQKKLGMKGGEGVDDIVINYGDCGKLHSYSVKTAFKKCIILIYDTRKITIGSSDRNTIQVKYFRDISNSTYYKKEKISVQKTNLLVFRDIINELLNNNQSSPDKLIQLIDKILRYITSLRSNSADIDLIIQWLNKSKNDGSEVSVQQNSPPPPPPPPRPTRQPSAAVPGYLGNIAAEAERRRLRREQQNLQTNTSAVADGSAVSLQKNSPQPRTTPPPRPPPQPPSFASTRPPPQPPSSASTGPPKLQFLNNITAAAERRRLRVQQNSTQSPPTRPTPPTPPTRPPPQPPSFALSPPPQSSASTGPPSAALPGYLGNIAAAAERRRLKREQQNLQRNTSAVADGAAAIEQQNQTNTRVVAQGAAAQLAKEPSNKSFLNELSQRLQNKKKTTNFSKLETTSGKAISANNKEPSTLSFQEKRAIAAAQAASQFAKKKGQ